MKVTNLMKGWIGPRIAPVAKPHVRHQGQHETQRRLRQIAKGKLSKAA